MASKPSSPDFVLSAVVAGLLFAVLFLVFDLPVLVSVIVALVAFVVGALVLRTKSEVQRDRESNERTLLKNGQAQRQAITQLARRVIKPEVSVRVAALLVNVDKILKTLRDDPKKIPSALQFLDYYLNTTVKVLTVYLNLSEQGVHDPEIQRSIAKTETALTTIAQGFEAQLAKLLSQDATDLDTEIKVLEQNLLGDGLIDSLKSRRNPFRLLRSSLRNRRSYERYPNPGPDATGAAVSRRECSSSSGHL